MGRPSEPETALLGDLLAEGFLGDFSGVLRPGDLAGDGIFDTFRGGMAFGGQRGTLGFRIDLT